MGIITGALAGLGEGIMKGAEFYGRHLLQKQAEEATAARDSTLMALREAADERAEERKRAPFRRAATEAEGLITKRLAELNPVSNDDDGNPVPRAGLAVGEENRIRAQALRAQGLESDATNIDRTALDEQRVDLTRRDSERQAERDRLLDECDRLRIEAQDKERADNKVYREESLKIQRAQITAANDRVTLQPTGDGRIMRVSKDGKSMGFLMDPDTNKPLQGPKDVAQSAQLLIKGNNEIIAGLLKEGGGKDVDRRVEELRAENRRLAGMADGGSPYPDGTELTRGGKVYVVKDGIPVLKDNKPAATPAAPNVTSAPQPAKDEPWRVAGAAMEKQRDIKEKMARISDAMKLQNLPESERERYRVQLGEYGRQLADLIRAQ